MTIFAVDEAGLVNAPGHARALAEIHEDLVAHVRTLIGLKVRTLPAD